MSHRDRARELEQRIGYSFRDPELLTCALTHGSFGDGRRDSADNQRLEFLGDRVLGLIAAERLVETYEDDEGALARRFNAIVRKEACARAAQRAGLGPALRMSKSTEADRGRENLSILGDACEALMAALYLDGGLDAARAFFDRCWAEELPEVAEGLRDPKTQLQEWALARYAVNPTYRLIERAGPDHRPVFAVEACVADLKPERGEGRSKQNAERSAAKALLLREGVRD
jgi:ribonuclease-3